MLDTTVNITEDTVIVTNNPAVKRFYEENGTNFKTAVQLVFFDSREAVFITVRDLIHGSWKLLNHAMAGNIPLHKHPYRSMALRKQESLDTQSLLLWEAAMERVRRGPVPPYTEDVLEDFRELDYTLFCGNVVL